MTEKGAARFCIFGPHYGVYPLPRKEDIPKRLQEIAPNHELLLGSTTREAAAIFSQKEKLSKLDKHLLTRGIVERFLGKNGRAIFNDPGEAFAKTYAEAGGKAYVYVFSWMEGKSPLGAIHISDLLLIFGLGGAGGKPIAMGMSFDEVYQQGIPMRKIWADYAKTGQITRMKIDGMIEIREL